METTTSLLSDSKVTAGKITRAQLALLTTPPGTLTHRPIPHIDVVRALVETLGFRHIGVVQDEYAVSPDGNKMFGVLDLDSGQHGYRFSIGIRNSHDKSMRLALTVGYRVFVCSNSAFAGDFEPLLARHSKNFSLINAVVLGVDQMQRSFEGMVKTVDRWRETQLTEVSAKMLIYRAFVESDLDAPQRLVRKVHDLYFNPMYEEFQPRTLWSLSNAFTSAFKELEPLSQFKATARLGGFLAPFQGKLIEA